METKVKEESNEILEIQEEKLKVSEENKQLKAEKEKLQGVFDLFISEQDIEKEVLESSQANYLNQHKEKLKEIIEEVRD